VFNRINKIKGDIVMESMRDLVKLIETIEDGTSDVKSQALLESNRITQMIESGELSEAELSELLGGLSALGGAASRAVGGAASRVGQAAAGAGQAVGGALKQAGQAIGGAAQQAGQAASGAAQQAGKAIGGAATGAAQGIANTYQAGEQRATAKKTLASLQSVQQTLTKLPFDPKFIQNIDKMPFGRVKALLTSIANSR